jgi:membrane protein
VPRRRGLAERARHVFAAPIRYTHGYVARERPQTPLPIRDGRDAVELAQLESGAPVSLTDRLQALDRRQQQTRGVRLVAALLKKYGDDQGGQLAALIAYYAFVSLFPLLLVMVTILGFVLQGDPSERQKILDGTLGQFPIISDYLKLQSLNGSTTALVIGIVGSLLAGMGFTGATQTAFNRIWHVPFKHRPNWLFSRLRGLGMLALLGTMAIVSTVAAGYVGSASHGAPAVIAGVVLAFVVNLALFLMAFRLLPAAELQWRDVLPGAIVAAILWQLLQHLGGYYVNHELKRTGPLYGIFAVVLGLLAWLYIGAQLTIVSAEINVVRQRRLWPRSFFSDPLLDADRRALTSSAETEERIHDENVEVSFDGPEQPKPDPAGTQPEPLDR